MKYDVKAKQLEISTLVDFKTDVGSLTKWLPESFRSLPNKPNSYSSVDGCEIYWIGPDHWLLRADIDQENILFEKLNLTCLPKNISAVTVSDALTFFSLTGPQADQVISILCPLDFHPSVFVDNGVSYTEAFGLKALLIRRNCGFEIAVDRSFTDMFSDVLNRAGAKMC